MDIELVAAVDLRGALGKNKSMAWYVPQELRHFKTLTMGGVIIMGRVTFESIGRPLPGRVSIVVSRQPCPKVLPPDTYWVPSLHEAVGLAQAQFAERKVWIGGGGQIYAQMLDQARQVHLSTVPLSVDGADAFFPALDPLQWTLVESKDVRDDHDGHLLFTYQRYGRRDA